MLPIDVIAQQHRNEYESRFYSNSNFVFFSHQKHVGVVGEKSCGSKKLYFWVEKNLNGGKSTRSLIFLEEISRKMAVGTTTNHHQLPHELFKTGREA